jgi:hypothetical protein
MALGCRAVDTATAVTVAVDYLKPAEVAVATEPRRHRNAVLQRRCNHAAARQGGHAPRRQLGASAVLLLVCCIATA